VHGLPPYELLLILLARLAVEGDFRAKGWAMRSSPKHSRLRFESRTMLDAAAPSRTLTATPSVGMRYGSVTLEGAAASGPQRMHLDIRTVRMALKRSS